MPGPYMLEYDGSHLRALIGRMGLDGATAAKMGQLVRKVGEIVRTRAVYNVTGYPVTYEGGAFVVRVRTGALRGSIEMQFPYGSPYVARVFVNGAMTADESKFGGFYSKPVPVSQYAGAIEWGHEEIDLKQTKLKGKTVPFFASRSSSTVGPYSARGLKPVVPGKEGYGEAFFNPALNAKLQAKGKGPMHFERRGKAKQKHYGGNSTFYIAFRRVGKEGWIIPEAKPRPFMAAAAVGVGAKGKTILRQGVREIMRGEA